MEQLLHTIICVQRQLDPKFMIDGILSTMVNTRTNYAKEIRSLLREMYGSRKKVFGMDTSHFVRVAEISAEESMNLE